MCFQPVAGVIVLLGVSISFTGNTLNVEGLQQLAAAFALVKRNVKVSHRSYARAVETSDDVVRQVRSVGIYETQECAFALYLNAKRRMLCEPMVVSRGTADKTFLHPREIFKHAVRLGAVSVIVAHNHPSGDATPSDDDIAETKQLIEAGRMMGIPLDDHVVIGKKHGDGPEYVSIRGLGCIDF